MSKFIPLGDVRGATNLEELRGKHIKDDDGIVHRITGAWQTNATLNIEDCDPDYFTQWGNVGQLPLTEEPVTCFACLSGGQRV